LIAAPTYSFDLPFAFKRNHACVTTLSRKARVRATNKTTGAIVGSLAALVEPVPMFYIQGRGRPSLSKDWLARVIISAKTNTRFRSPPNKFYWRKRARFWWEKGKVTQDNQ